MKRHIKKVYMFVTHPVLFWRFTIKNNFFVKSRANIKRIGKLKLGKNVSFGYDARINFYDASDEERLLIGDNCYFCNRVSFLVGGTIEVGNDVLVASNVCIASENHGVNPLSDIPYKDQELVYKNVKIGSGTWIGEQVVILPGVVIGEKCVIGAGSVVTKDVPDFSMAVGNPAKVIKRFDIEKAEWVKG